MQHEKARPFVNVALILEQNGKYLLSRRKNTGYYDGYYGLVSGHAETGESATAAMCREAMEEVGIEIKPENLEVVLILHQKTNRENIDIFMLCHHFENRITNKEPDKCDDLSYHSLDELPQNTIPHLIESLMLFKKGIKYAELGWEKQLHKENVYA